jgi:hypothetical protein
VVSSHFFLIPSYLYLLGGERTFCLFYVLFEEFVGNGSLGVKLRLSSQETQVKNQSFKSELLLVLW